MAANLQNLVPNTERTPEEIRANCKKAGIASGESRRQKKKIAEALREVLGEPASKGSDKTRLDAIIAKTIKKLYDNPDVKDLKTLAEILGEFKTTTEIEGSLSVNKPRVVFLEDGDSKQ